VRAVFREMLALDADRDFIVVCASLCEGALVAESQAVAVGDFEEAAVWADEASRQSSYAFAVATW
jgi:hypothetical protein